MELRECIISYYGITCRNEMTWMTNLLTYVCLRGLEWVCADMIHTCRETTPSILESCLSGVTFS